MEQSRDHAVSHQYLKQNVAMLSNEESNGVGKRSVNKGTIIHPNPTL